MIKVTKRQNGGGNMVDPQKIVDHRTRRAWTQQRLADVTGVSLRTIQRIEAGQAPSPESVLAIAEAFGVSPEELRLGAEQQTAGEGAAERRDGFLARLVTGSDVVNVLADTHEYGFGSDSPETQEEADLVAVFAQTLQDIGDIWSDLDLGARVEMGFEIHKQMEALSQTGFWVFGKVVDRPHHYRSDMPPLPFRCAIFRVVRASNPEIIKVPGDQAAMYQDLS